MEISTTGALVSIFSTLAGSSLLTAFASNYFLRKKFDAEAESIITKNYRDLIAELREQLRVFDEEKVKNEKRYLEKLNSLMENILSLNEKVSRLEGDNNKQKGMIEKLERDNINLSEKIKTLTNGKCD